MRGREPLVADLVERVTERRVTALLGPRRYGKTSVLGRVAADLGAEVTVVAVDLYELSSIADLAIRLDTALATAGAVSKPLTTLAVGAELNLGAVRIDLRRPAAARPDPLATVHSQLQLITELAAQAPTLLICDEFSGVARVDGASGLLRTHLQPHYSSLGLLFAGSEPSVMRMLFAEQSEPFYGQADLVEIGPLSRAAVSEMVGDGFAATGRDAGVIGARVAAFAGGHPQRSMQLADALWRRVQPGETADDGTWAEALVDVRSQTASGLERLYSSLAGRQRDVLRLVASGESPLGAAAELLGVRGGTAQYARDALLDTGHLHLVDGSLQLVDPIFADWLRHRLPI